MKEMPFKDSENNTWYYRAYELIYGNITLDENNEPTNASTD